MTQAMTLEANKTVVRRYLEEAWGRGDVAVAREVLGPVYQIQALEQGGPADRVGDRAIVERSIVGYHQAFPDLRITVDQLVAEGDAVVARWTGTGTHTGAFHGIPPTGKPVRYSGVTFYRLVDGTIVEETYLGDRLGLWQELGAVPDTTALVQRLQH